jgi:hypothetical protein
VGVRGAVFAATVSMLICALGLPDAYRGLAIDVALLVGAGLLVMGAFRPPGLAGPLTGITRSPTRAEPIAGR